jgi:hypothetical protein
VAGFSSAPHRVRALEKLLQPSGVAIVVELPSTSEEERRENAKLLEAAAKAGRPVVSVTIRFDTPPRAPATAENVPEPTVT